MIAILLIGHMDFNLPVTIILIGFAIVFSLWDEKS
jgi:hypothetical protein